jgi:transposase
MTANNADKKPEAATPTNKKSPNPAIKKKVAGKKTKKAEPMSSKADLIRKVAGILKAKGEVVRPKDIVEILKKEGVTVAPAQVSMTLKAAGYRPLRKRTKRSEARSVAQAPSTGKKADAVTVDDLIAAKKVVQQLGGTERALKAIEALKRFEG